MDYLNECVANQKGIVVMERLPSAMGWRTGDYCIIIVLRALDRMYQLELNGTHDLGSLSASVQLLVNGECALSLVSSLLLLFLFFFLLVVVVLLADDDDGRLTAVHVGNETIATMEDNSAIDHCRALIHRQSINVDGCASRPVAWDRATSTWNRLSAAGFIREKKKILGERYDG